MHRRWKARSQVTTLPVLWRRFCALAYLHNDAPFAYYLPAKAFLLRIPATLPFPFRRFFFPASPGTAPCPSSPSSPSDPAGLLSSSSSTKGALAPREARAVLAAEAARRTRRAGQRAVREGGRASAERGVSSPSCSGCRGGPASADAFFQNAMHPPQTPRGPRRRDRGSPRDRCPR